MAFDIAQFFLLLNHQLLPMILDKASFDFKIFLFFQNYLVSKKTKYLWNYFSSSFFNINIGVRQGFALSPILLALYIFHTFEKILKNLKIPISVIFFVDDGLFISQDKSFNISNSHLFCSYHIISSLLKQFGLVIEHGKIEVFYFSRSYGVFNPLLLDLTTLRGPILHFKITWCYLEFIFDRKLTFQQYINFYANKIILTTKCMKMLRNLLRGLIPTQKHLLYRTCILSIMLYGFP